MQMHVYYTMILAYIFFFPTLEEKKIPSFE